MIENYSFGKIVVDGSIYVSDIKIINQEVTPDWWRKSGHIVCMDDVIDLLENKPKHLVLGTGSPGFMKADSQLRSWAKKQGIELIEEPTGKAIEIFNQLLERGETVAAGFHLTC